MPECEKIQACPFFNGKFASLMPSAVESMKRRYCLGDKSKCARYLVSTSVGKEHVPVDLTPNQNERAAQIIQALRGGA